MGVREWLAKSRLWYLLLWLAACGGDVAQDPAPVALPVCREIPGVDCAHWYACDGPIASCGEGKYREGTDGQRQWVYCCEATP